MRTIVNPAIGVDDMSNKSPRRGESVWFRERYEAGKHPTGIITQVNYDEQEVVVIYVGGDVGHFQFDDLDGHRTERAGKTWWIIGPEPSPDEVAERMKAK